MLDDRRLGSEKGLCHDRHAALRLRGRGDRVRLRKIGHWNGDTWAELRVACRTTVAADKVLGESLRAAREAGLSWSEIATALGVEPTVSNWDETTAAMAADRRVIWNRGQGAKSAPTNSTHSGGRCHDREVIVQRRTNLSPGRQPGVRRVRTSSSATRISLMLLSWETRRRTLKACSGSMVKRSMRMPWACPMMARFRAAIRRPSTC